MKTHGHWSKFSEALESLQLATPAPNAAELYRGAAQMLAIAQRFYLPDSTNILAGKVFDESIKELFRLPYEVTAVLSETEFTGAGREPEGSWKMTLAFDPKGPANTRIGMFEPSACSERGFVILSIYLAAGRRHLPWVLFPAAVLVDMVEGELGIRKSVHCDPGIYEDLRRAGVNVLGERSEMQGDVVSVTNLCAILNLSNVTTRDVTAPTALNRKRAQRGKLPFYDYHILEVDGQRWDSPFDSAPEESGGFRSHLRRGHIRRLSDRHVWVRAAYVRGAIPGFVDKDYKL